MDAQGKVGWEIPQNGWPGAWKGPVKGVLKPHVNGLHLAKVDYLIEWFTEHNFLAEIEVGGEFVEGLDCVVARKARLTHWLPCHRDKLKQFSLDNLLMLPKIVAALGTYPKQVTSLSACLKIIQDKGMQDIPTSFSSSHDFKFLRAEEARLYRDTLNCIEYKIHSETARISLNTFLNVIQMLEYKTNIIDNVKVVSNNVAKAISHLHQNYLFMCCLEKHGYEHKSELDSMKNFFIENGYSLALESRNNASDIFDFFDFVRKKQNDDVLPAFGIRVPT